MDALGRRQRLVLGAVLLVALALRLAFVLSQRGDVLFEHPALDEQRYVDAARAFASGGGLEARPFWQPPGILYALGAIFRVAGPGLLAPRLVQVLLSTACVLLLFAIARRLFSIRIALAAAAILALHGVLVFECYELLPPTWILFFDLIALLLLLRARERASTPVSFAAGLALGVSAVFSPTVLPFVAVAMIWVRRPAPIVALIVGVALPIAPVAWRNFGFDRELVLVSSNGGLNFYLGNNERYPATFTLRPGREWDALTHEPAQHGFPTAAGGSSYFYHRGLAFFRAHPGRAAALLGRKLYLFCSGGEIPRDTDLYTARRSSWVLRALVWPRPIWFPDALLIPLALVGIVLGWRRRREVAVPLGFLATQALVLAAFFVSARHRVPSLAMFALFAASGGAALIERWRRAPGAQRWLPLALLAALVAVLDLPTWEASLSFAAERDFYRGLILARSDPPAAIERFEAALAIDPNDARLWFELGNARSSIGDQAGAIDAWRRAAALDEWDGRASRRVSTALAREGDLDGAIAAIQAHIDARKRDPADYAPDYLNLGFLRSRRGQYARAIEDLRAAASADPELTRRELAGMTRAALNDPTIADPTFWKALGDLHRDLGNADLAQRCWRRAGP